MRPILTERALADLAVAARRDFTPAAIDDAIGLAGQSARARRDLAGLRRLTRTGSATHTWLRLFTLGLPVATREAQAALAPLALADAVAGGLLVSSAGEVRAALQLTAVTLPGGEPGWVVSDLDGDLAPGPLPAEYVLGVSAAAHTLAGATVRTPVQRAADIGTGCGILALGLSGHAEQVVATDLSPRALHLAATTAALNGRLWDLRQGSLLEPLGADRFDLIVSNPPFIVGPGFAPGADGFRYRDSGQAGDELCRQLITGLPGALNDGGTAQLLANWVVTDEPWDERLTGWLAGSGCDAWIWQREVAEPAEYVALWLRDDGDRPGSPTWGERYDRWLDWFAAAGVAGVGMGLVNLRRTGSQSPVVVAEDVVQAHVEVVGGEVADWFARARWLAEQDGPALLDARLVAAEDLVRSQQQLLGPDGWHTAVQHLRQSGGLRWELEVDDAVARCVAACTGGPPVRLVLAVLAAGLGAETAAVEQALLPVLRDLVQRGFLLPDVLVSGSVAPGEFAAQHSTGVR